VASTIEEYALVGEPDCVTSCFTIVKSDDRRGTVRMAIRGDLDAATAGCVTEFLTNAMIGPRPRTLVVDLADVPFLDAAGVRALVRSHLRARSRHISLRVVAPQRLVRRVLELTGLWDMLAGEPDNRLPRGRHRVDAAGRPRRPRADRRVQRTPGQARA
jgi:anti-anti-sigma factor